jgi:hypothetical protein
MYYTPKAIEEMITAPVIEDVIGNPPYAQHQAMNKPNPPDGYKSPCLFLILYVPAACLFCCGAVAALWQWLFAP